jgi:hypothetical protein
MPTLYAIACLNGQTISRTYPDVPKPYLRYIISKTNPEDKGPGVLFDPSQEYSAALVQEGAFNIRLRYDEPFTTQEYLDLALKGCQILNFSGGGVSQGVGLVTMYAAFCDANRQIQYRSWPNNAIDNTGNVFLAGNTLFDVWINYYTQLLEKEGATSIFVSPSEEAVSRQFIKCDKKIIFTGENPKGPGGQGGDIVITPNPIPEIPRDPRIIESEQSPQIPQNPDTFFGVSSFSGASSNISEGVNFSIDNRFQATDGLTNATVAGGVTSQTVTINASFCSPEGPRTSSFGQAAFANRVSIARAYKEQLERNGNKNVLIGIDSTPPLPTDCPTPPPTPPSSTTVTINASFCSPEGPRTSSFGQAAFANRVSIARAYKEQLERNGNKNVLIGIDSTPPLPTDCASASGGGSTGGGSNTTRDILLRASFCNKGVVEFRGKAVSVEVGPGDSDSFFNNFVSIQSIKFKNELKEEGFTNIEVRSGVNPPTPNCNTTRDILLRASFCNNGEPAFRGKAVSTEVGPGDSDTFFKNFVSIQSIKFKNELKEEGFTNVEVTSGVNPPNPNCGGIPQVLAAVQFQECDGSIVSLDTPSAPTSPSVTINGISISLDPINKGILGNLAYSYKSNTSAVFSKPGVYTVTFGNVPGWVTPNPAFFTLNSANDFGGGNEANRIYTRPNCDDGSGTTGGGGGSGTPPSSTTTTTTTSRPTTTTTTTTRFIPRASWLKQINPTDNRRYVFDVTEGLFSNNVRNLITFFTGSTSENYSRYYTHVYDENPKTSLTSSIQFSISYGHSGGSGSLDEGNKINITPTRAIYSQYRNLVLGKSNIKFNLTGRETDSIYVINYQSKRLKDRLNAGVIELNIAHLSGSQFLAGGGTRATHTGSNVKLAGNNRVLRLIDDSKISTSPDYTDVGYSYNIVSGTLETGVYNQTAPHYYGKLIPSLGVVILDGNKLDLSASFATSKASEIEGYNAIKLYKSFSGSALVQDNSGDYLGMKARRVIREYNDYYFIRVLNNEYNFTNNLSRIKSEVPDFMVYKDIDSGNPHWKTNLGLPLDPTSPQGLEDIRRRTLLKLENGEITEPFANNSQVYITTVGLYNAQRELIAVGKLPKPILKNFTEESIFTVKLKY